MFKEVHEERFAGHLRDVKIYSQLGKAYWWPKMYRILLAAWCRACEVCASKQLGRQIKPYLTPIPDEGAFDLVGVDVIQFPQSNFGKKYAIVFVDYLFNKVANNSPTSGRRGDTQTWGTW